VPDVRPLAVLCSDLHLSERAPACRAEKGQAWLDVQARGLSELDKLAKELDAVVVCAGDVFDRWNPGPELINFALEHLPQMYAVPGQHDLPYHNYSNKKKSAYWTLVKAQKVFDLRPGEVTRDRNLCLVGFPWGVQLTNPPPVPEAYKDWVRLAVVHRYCWVSGHKFPGADESNHANEHRKRLNGFDAAVVGDNHQHFLSYGATGDFPTILNCGTFFRRKRDEINYTPKVGVLYSDGTVRTRELPRTVPDEFTPVSPLEKLGLSDEFLELLEDLPDTLSDKADDLRDFRQHLVRRLDGVPEPVRREVLDALGEGGDAHAG
jgi:hypothetical protein